MAAVMARDQPELDTYDFHVRSAADPALVDWADRARRAGLVVARRHRGGGRIQWAVSSGLGRLVISQIAEGESRCTLLTPSVGQLEIVRKLRDSGLILPRRR